MEHARDRARDTITSRHDVPPTARSPGEDELRAEVQRLAAELDRYRAHAQRTSKLYLAATDYAEWVRERARTDAELALRKARARADKLMATTGELERTELALAVARRDLVRLQALTDETRKLLAGLLAAGIEALSRESALRPEALDELDETLRARLSKAGAAQSAAGVEPQSSEPDDANQRSAR